MSLNIVLNIKIDKALIAKNTKSTRKPSTCPTNSIVPTPFTYLKFIRKMEQIRKTTCLRGVPTPLKDDLKYMYLYHRNDNLSRKISTWGGCNDICYILLNLWPVRGNHIHEPVRMFANAMQLFNKHNHG